MGRKVTENHKVERVSQEAAEELIKQQNAGEDFVLGEGEEQTEEEQTETQKESDSGSDAADSEEEQKNLEKNGEILHEAGNLKVAPQENAFERTVVLTGASTYLDSGIRYFKNNPVKVTNQKVYEQLVKTGLFVGF